MRISDIIKGLAALGTPSFKRDAAGNAVGLVANGIALSLAMIGLNRPPRVTDNSTLGYSSASIWQAGGELYAPTVAPDTNSALWQKIESVGGGCFTDVATAANTIFAGGCLRRLNIDPPCRLKFDPGPGATA